MSKSKLAPERPVASDKNDNARDFAAKLMEYLVVPAFVLDTQGRVMIWNRACERLTGVAASSVIGTADHWHAFYDEPHPSLADLVVQGRANEVDALYAENDTTTEPRHGLSAENWCDMPRLGTRHYLVMDAGPIYDGAGVLIGALETLRDMTALKEAQLAVEQLARHDGLTALANRRSFDDTLQREWRHAIRESHSLSLLMVDVDYFKRYNDNYGHLAGDECLKRVAGAMASQVRVSDTVARYGGEEFAIILPNQSSEGAASVAERIRSTVEQAGLPHALSDTGHVTVSIGVATAITSSTSGPEQLVADADAALYRAKHAGRNRIGIPIQKGN